MTKNKKLNLKYTILHYLELSGLTREDLIQNLNVPRATFYSRLEDGNWTLEQLDSIMRWLRIPVEKINSAMGWRPTVNLGNGEMVTVVYV